MTEHEMVDPGAQQANDAGDDEDLYGGLDDIPQVASGPDPVPSRPAENPVSKIKGSRAPAAKKAASSDQQEAPEEIAKRTVLVANLQWWTTDADVQNLCEAHGTVVEVEFFHDEANGKSKGCVRVIMGSAAEAAACCKALRGKVVDGRMCTVTLVAPVKKEAGPRTERGSGPKQQVQAPRRFAEQARSGGQPALPPMPQGMHVNMPPLPPGMDMPPMPPGMLGLNHNVGMSQLPVSGMSFYQPVYTAREPFYPHHKRPRR